MATRIPVKTGRTVGRLIIATVSIPLPLENARKGVAKARPGRAFSNGSGIRPASPAGGKRCCTERAFLLAVRCKAPEFDYSFFLRIPRTLI